MLFKKHSLLVSVHITLDKGFERNQKNYFYEGCFAEKQKAFDFGFLMG